MLPPEQIPASRMIRIQAAVRTGTPSRQITYESAKRAAGQDAGSDFQMKRFQDEIYQRLEGTPNHYTVVSCAVDISDGGFRAMHEDGLYLSQILRLIEHDFGTSYSPRRVCVHVQVGSNLDEYHAHSWSAADADDYEVYSKHSFYKRAAGSHNVIDEPEKPSAYNIYREHLQMQFEKLDRPPAQHTKKPKETTRSIYEEMGYADPSVRDFQG